MTGVFDGQTVQNTRTPTNSLDDNDKKRDIYPMDKKHQAAAFYTTARTQNNNDYASFRDK